MLKHIITYAPARIIPAVLSLVNLSVFTRLMAPDDYGIFALIIVTVMSLEATLGLWLSFGVMRFYTKAKEENQLDKLLASCGLLLFTTTSIVALIATILFFVNDHQFFRYIFPIAILYFIPYTLQQLVLRIHMSGLHSKKYTALTLLQTTASTTAAILCLTFLEPSPTSALIGMAFGILLPVLIDARLTIQILNIFKSKLEVVKKIIKFSWATAVSGGLFLIAKRMNVFILFALLGAASVGTLNASIALTEQAISTVFLLVAMAAQPISVQTQDTKSPQELNEILRQNAIWIFGLGLPSTVGIMMIAPELSQIFLGEGVRENAEKIIPWLAFAAFFNGVKNHYFANSFFLAHKIHYQIYMSIIAISVFAALNFTLIPTYGIFGAVYATAIAEALLCAVAYIFTRRAVIMPLPWKEITYFTIAALLMALAIYHAPFDSLVLNLVWKLCLGGISYFSIVVLLNVADIRQQITSKLNR